MPASHRPRSTAALVVLVLGLGLSGPIIAAGPADGIVANAQKLLDKGEAKAAAIEFRNAIQAEPQNAAAHFGLGRALAAVGDARNAERELRAAGEAGWTRGEVDIELATLFMRQERFGDVLDEFRAEGRPEAEQARILLLRGNAYLGLNQVDAGEQELEEALKLAPQSAETLWSLGRSKLAHGDAAGALVLLERAIAADRKMARAFVLLAVTKLQLRDPEGARAAIDEAIRIDGRDGTARVVRAELVGDSEEKLAADDIAQALKANGRNPRALIVDAALKLRHQQLREAEASLMKIAKPEQTPRAFYLLARVNLAMGQLSQAESNVTHFLALFPDDPAAVALKSDLLMRRGRTAEAVDLLQKALEKRPDHPALVGLLGTAYARNGQAREAAALLDRASEVLPRDAGTRLRLAGQDLQLGRAEQALAELETARAEGPLAGPAAIMAVQSLLTLGRIDEARKVAADIAAGDQKSAVGEMLLGLVALRAEGAAAARAHFVRATEIAPKDSTAAIDLARSWQLDRQPEEARKALDAALARMQGNVQLMAARAELEFGDGKPEAGTEWLERARAADPKATLPRLRLVLLYLAANEPQKALPVAREVEQLAPQAPEALGGLAEALLASGDRAAAIPVFERYVEITGQSPKALARLAEVLLADGRQPAALEMMRRAVAAGAGDPLIQAAFLDLARRTGTLPASLAYARELGGRLPEEAGPRELEAVLLEEQKQAAAAVVSWREAALRTRTGDAARRIGQGLFRTGAPDDAKALLRRWVAANPADQDSRLLLAAFAAVTDGAAEARTQFEALVARNPNHVVALNELALALPPTDPQALDYAERAWRLAPGSAEVADTLGWILLQRGDAARAMPLLKQGAAAPDPGNAYHYAIALQRAGDRDGARQVLSTVLKGERSFPEKAEAEHLLKELGG